ncbi:hypothetical protein SAY87_022234 [Trapa incisa]|uniref:Uncharacterized protein n=1 Tax=Trapa incisa TaxID=236973 RepID=A0AAN7PT78_9MYRT|nr:hypothetical protein SAY87_022234 [Trapa incisa]
MWNLVDQYKEKLKVVESDIDNLIESLANENTRILNIEKDLRNLKASCSCIDIVPTGVSSVQTYENSEPYSSTSPQADQTLVCESSDEVRESAIDLSRIYESSDKASGKQDKQSVNINDEQLRMNKAGQGDLEDSNLSNGASTKVSYSQMHNTPPQKGICSIVELDKQQSSGVQVSPDLPVASISHKERETIMKIDTSCQLLNPRKPRRRLQPASSVLVRNMSYWDFDDDTEKPKGSKAGKKKDRGEVPRTTGNTNLIRLLKGNNHI